MKNNKSVVVALSLVLLLVLLLTACGSNTSDEPESVNNTPIISDLNDSSGEQPEVSDPTAQTVPQHTPVDALPAAATLTLDEMLLEPARHIDSYNELSLLYAGVESFSEMYDDVLSKLDYSYMEGSDDYAYADYTDLVNDVSFEPVPTSALSGKRIAIISGDDVVIASARGENSSEVFRFNASCADEDDWYGTDMPIGVIYLDNTLYVFTYESSVKAIGDHYEVSERTHIKRYDVSGDKTGILLSDFAQDGRLTGVYRDNSSLYILTAASTGDLSVDSTGTFIPAVEHNGVNSELPVSAIIHTPFTDSLEYSMLTVYDLDKGKDLTSTALTGYYSHGYVIGDCVYLLKCSTAQVISEAEPYNQYLVNSCKVGTITNVIALSANNNLALEGTISVNGYLPGQESFWSDADNLYLATVVNDINYRIFTDPEWGFVNYVTDATTPETTVSVADKSLNFISAKTIPCSTAPSRVICINNTIWALNPASGMLSPLEDYDAESAIPVVYLERYKDGSFIGVSLAGDHYSVSLCTFNGPNCSITASADFDALLLTNPLYQVDDHLIIVDADGFTRFTAASGVLLRAGRLSSYFLSGETEIHIASNYYFCSGSAMLVADKDWNVEAVVSFAFG